MKIYTYITLIVTFLVLLFVIFIPFIPLIAKGVIVGILSIISGINIYFLKETNNN
ncbi:hypothetical protein [Hathewaya massiliensis]|uniref:hypothetical protein n=1 Tax=Hathewaya massiliensis TaxID=1964382 RepID=UPI00163C07C9|nr:hypothetical protein [Hathewaya massiliensis]